MGREKKTRFGQPAYFRSFLYTVRTLCPFLVLTRTACAVNPCAFSHQILFLSFVHVACSTPIHFQENQTKTRKSSPHADAGVGYESASLAKCLDQIQPTISVGSSWFFASHNSPFSAMMSNIYHGHVSEKETEYCGARSLPRQLGMSDRDNQLRAWLFRC